MVYIVSERPDRFNAVRNYEINVGRIHYGRDADGSGNFDSSDVLYIKQTMLGMIYPDIVSD